MAPSSYYRSPSKAPSTKWARHIDAWMRREGLSQTGAFRRLRGAFGLGEESRSAFLPYLVNKPLDEAQQAAVAAIIGWPEDATDEPAPAESTPDLATALLALAAELGEMRKERQSLAAKVEQLSAVVDQLVAADLDRRGSEGPSTHGAHRPTGAAGR